MPYLDIASLKADKTKIAERVRSKAYHKMRDHCMTNGYDKETATAGGRISGKYHLNRWKSRLAA